MRYEIIDTSFPILRCRARQLFAILKKKNYYKLFLAFNLAYIITLLTHVYKFNLIVKAFSRMLLQYYIFFFYISMNETNFRWHSNAREPPNLRWSLNANEQNSYHTIMCVCLYLFVQSSEFMFNLYFVVCTCILIQYVIVYHFLSASLKRAAQSASKCIITLPGSTIAARFSKFTQNKRWKIRR